MPTRLVHIAVDSAEPAGCTYPSPETVPLVFLEFCLLTPR